MIKVKLWSVIEWYFRPLFKWFLRQTTRLCELQRICYGRKAGAPRCLAVEDSLLLSRTLEIQELTALWERLCSERRITESNVQDHRISFVSVVLRVKKISPQVHSQFVSSLGRCVEQILWYKQLLFEIEELRKCQYDSDLMHHEEKLLHLWDLLMPNQPLDGRVTKQWQDIGFQGDDPKTDFRGMGMLGLDNLLYFAREFPSLARLMLNHSHHPVYGYTFAIVGINITSMAYFLLKDGSAKTYMYNLQNSMPAVNMFHQFYCYLFYEFDKLWMESKPSNLMEFSFIHKRFETNIRNLLSCPENLFRMNLHIDNV